MGASGGTGGRRQGNGTRSTYANNGEFEGSSNKMATMNGLGRAGGGPSPPPGSNKPRALFVSKDGSPVLTWNEIEQINMDDLNTVMGPFNPGAKPMEAKKGGRKFRGFRRGNGEGFVDASKTGAMMSFDNVGGGGDRGASPLQSKRMLKKSNQSGMRPRQPSARK
jgi:hypothetical protein